MHEEPSEDQQIQFTNLLNSIAFLYPCRDCGEHFTKLLAMNPVPKSIYRRTAIKYVCNLHNHVNERLNKPIFDCDKAAEYWGGDCGFTNKSG